MTTEEPQFHAVPRFDPPPPDDATLARRLYDAWCSDDARPPFISAADWFHGPAGQPIAVWRRADLGARPLHPG